MDNHTIIYASKISHVKNSLGSSFNNNSKIKDVGDFILISNI